MLPLAGEEEVAMLGSAPASRRRESMAMCDRGRVLWRCDRMADMSGGTPAGLRALTGRDWSKRRWVVLVMSSADTAKQRSATAAELAGVEPVSHRLTDWKAAREASFGEEAGEDSVLARQTAEAAWMRRQRASSSAWRWEEESWLSGAQVQVVQCR
jgi:hypothetical protein